MENKLFYAQVDKTLTKTEYLALMGEDRNSEMKFSNKGKHLMLFNDQSDLMNGTPFTTLI